MSNVVDAAAAELPHFRGTILTPEDARYDAARQNFNRRMMGRPGLIAQCAGVADVRAALRLAQEHGLELAVRCGGHSLGGWSSPDGGLVVDLTPMRGIRVDPATSTAWVGGGTRALDLIVEAAEFGLAPVTGVTPDVGLGGLLLGVGEGYLTPRYGFGVDNVLEYELVTADGSVLRVSALDHPDLFWGLRGAGANFGVVTAIRLRLFPLPEQGVGGYITFGHDDVPRVTRHLWDVMQHGSQHYYPLATYSVDEEGRMRVAVMPGHVGPPEIAERELSALRACGTPISDETETMSYVELVAGYGSDGAHGGDLDAPDRRSWEFYQFPFDGDGQRQMDLLLAQTAQLAGLRPMPLFTVWRSVAPDTVDAHPCAAPRHRGIELLVASVWQDPADDERQVQLVDDFAATFRDSGLVVEAVNAMNHIGKRDVARVRRVYGDEAYDRLAALKSVYDPDNRFRHNFNIPPAGA